MSERTLRFRIVILKVCLLLTLLSIISVAIYAQKNPAGDQNAVGDRLTMNAKNVTYREVFSEIKRQTGKVVWYDSNFDDTRKINVAFKETPLNDVMNFILKNTGLSWRTRNEAILINGKDIDKSVGANPKGISTNQPVTGRSDTLNNLIDVTGTVTDENESPIPGATVLVKGTQIGTTSNGNGVFNLKGVPGNATVTISSISFITKDVLVKNKNNLEIIHLTKYVGQLDETVILAYTTTTGRKLIGNVSTVNAKAIQNSPVNNPILAVTGRVPGIQISQASGFSGTGVEIVVQGLNSLNKGNVPFYVIDGIPYTQSLLPNLGNILRTSGNRGAGDGPTTGTPLSFINPNDIESIEILKDADATAIYGSRAANGAIIITTKKGKSGNLKVDLNIQSGFGKVAKKLDLLNTQEYLKMRRETRFNDNTPIRKTDYDINGTWDTTKYTDWQKVLIGNKAKYNDIQLSFSGGSPNVQYLISSNYHKETTVFPTDLSDQKTSIRFSISAQSKNQKLKVNLSGSNLIDNNKLPNSDITQRAMIFAPNMPDLKNPDGTLNWAQNSSGNSTITVNPFASLTSTYSNKTTNLIANSNVSYEILEGLNFKTLFGYTNLKTDEVSIFPASSARPERRPSVIRSATYGFNEIKSWIIEPQLAYNLKIKNGVFDVIAGATIQQKDNNRRVIMGSGYSTDKEISNLNAATVVSIPNNSTIASVYKYNAAFANINIDIKDRYILNLTGRRDGSSRFGSENHFHNFGAIGFAWIFSEENPIKNFSNILSYGKLRGSIGTTGNDQIGDYSYLSLYQNINSDVPYRGSASLNVSRLTNPFLQWEVTKKHSIGLDLGFLNDRFLVNAVYYNNVSSNMLIISPLPSTGGPGGLDINLPATVKNYGLEVVLTSHNIKNGNFSWMTDINFTVPKNKLASFPNIDLNGYSNSYSIGQPINKVSVYRAFGVNPITGVYQFLDADGKVTNTPGSDRRNYNKNINPNPTFYGGVNNSITYGNFTLDFLVQFVKKMGQNLPYSNMPGVGLDNQTKDVLNRWKKEGDNVSVQKFTSSDINAIIAFSNRLTASDAYWQDASFMRLKNVSLSYIVPKRILSKIDIQSLRIYLNGQNLLTVTGYDGLDPESLSNFTLPPLRVFTGGIQVSF